MPADPASGPRFIAIAGPTASGKTAAAVAVAQAHDAEIVSVDSALVYRGMDIGTAKPTATERGGVAHHLIDIRDPLQPYSAAEFAADARRLIEEINARGKLAVLVGGTMLYFKSLFEGLHAMPPADSGIRAELEEEAQARGWAAMHAELARVDPVTAARLAPADAQRIQRALEVFRLSGLPLSHFHAEAGAAQDRNAMAPLALLSLEPSDRAWLHERIAQRFDAMLAAGFVDEVRSLRARGDLSPELPSMRCVGYRQAWELLDQEVQSGGQLPIAQLRDKSIFATRQLAKRQLTWLRGMGGREVISCDAPDARERLVQAAERAL